MKKLLVLGIILSVAAFLRFYKLTTVPPSLSHDEVAIAYNAYSILKTGKDEYGMPYPLLFRSFDDYKLPGMVYSTVPFVALFGRSTLSARLPSALYGTLSVLVMYGISAEIIGAGWLALLLPLALALQPWHINFSRQLFESNAAVFWFMLGTYFLLRSRKKYGEILWAALSYVTALYFYYSVRLVIPFVVLFYLISQWKTIIKNWKTSVLVTAISLMAFIPMGKEMLSPGGFARINTVSVANDKSYIARKYAYTKIIAAHPTVLNKIVYNRRTALLETVIENYWKNIDPHNLFVTGTGTYGALYPIAAVLLPLGFVYLSHLPPFVIWLVTLWLFTGFLPGAFSTNQPNTLRTLIASPAFALLSGLGATLAIKKWRWVAGAFLFIAFLLVFPKFLSAYFVDNPTNNALGFGDGNKQMVQYVTAHQAQYDRIYISGYYWRPYIFMLYWGGINPASYQNGGTRDHFGKYYFTSASWDTSGIKLMDSSFRLSSLPHDNKTLFILSPEEYTLHEATLTKIATINGSVARNVFVAARLR